MNRLGLHFDARLVDSSRRLARRALRFNSLHSDSTAVDGPWYGTRILVQAAPTHVSSIPHSLRPWIRTSISRAASFVDTDTNSMSPDVSVVFLGTGSGGRPNTMRAASSLCIRVNGSLILVDCGEGTQRQLALSACLGSGGYLHLEKILITHLHADHVSGLPGLLLQIHDAARNRHEEHTRRKTSTAPIHTTRHSLDIYGPPGLYQYLTSSLGWTRSLIPHIQITVHELRGGLEDNPNRSPPRETFLQKHMTQQSLSPIQGTHTWILQQPSSQVTREQALFNSPTHYVSDSWTIRAAEIYHRRGVPTFGFVLEEPPSLPKLLVDKAMALGIPPGKKYRLLKQGFSVHKEDGTVVHPHQVLDSTLESPPRKLVILGDHYDTSIDMVQLSQQAHVIVTEATLKPEETHGKEIQKRGHSTPQMAGELANKVQAQVLLLNHISNGNSSLEDISHLVTSAQARNHGVSQIMVAYDFLEFIVPRQGWTFKP